MILPPKDGNKHNVNVRFCDRGKQNKEQIYLGGHNQPWKLVQPLVVVFPLLTRFVAD